MFKKCRVCGRKFKTHPSEFKRRKCCSHHCSGIFLFRNKPKSEEHKRKIGLAHLGKKRHPFSKKWRDNLSKARKGMKFTDEHRKNISLAQRMEKGNNWKGGIVKCSEGYILIKNWEHPFAKRGYIRRSHLALEKTLGRYIHPPEEVHHLNKIKNDDRPKNLMLFSNHSEHLKFEHSHQPNQ